LEERWVKTDELIRRLAAEAEPVRPLLTPVRRAALWTVAAAICIMLGVMHFGVRHDAAAAWHSAGVIVRIAFLAATMWLAVVTAFRLSVPGHDLRPWSRWWPLAALAALMALVGAEVVAAAIFGDMGSPMRDWTCVRKVAFVGAAPAVLAIVLIQRAAPLEARWVVLLGVLAAGGAGALTSEIACPIHAPLHIFLWHVLPVAASAALGAVLGGIFWRQRRPPRA
jgi:hypothetical protein